VIKKVSIDLKNGDINKGDLGSNNKINTHIVPKKIVIDKVNSQVILYSAKKKGEKITESFGIIKLKY